MTEDTSRAVKLLREAAADGLIQDTAPQHQPEMVERLAAAFAEQREQARRPFLALAEEYERHASLMRVSMGGDSDAILRWRAFEDAAASIHRVAKVTS